MRERERREINCIDLDSCCLLSEFAWNFRYYLFKMRDADKKGKDEDSRVPG